jgi:hypothetical protein
MAYLRTLPAGASPAATPRAAVAAFEIRRGRIWKLSFVDRGPNKLRIMRDAAWNCGRDLVETLGHLRRVPLHTKY